MYSVLCELFKGRTIYDLYQYLPCLTWHWPVKVMGLKLPETWFLQHVVC